MKIAAVANPPSDRNLRLLAKLGVPDLVYYNMQGMPTELPALRAEQERVARQGLRIAVVEGGPPIDRIVLGREGRDAQGNFTFLSGEAQLAVIRGMPVVQVETGVVEPF